METLNEQVQKQLEHLKYLVDGEVEREKSCKEWGIPYTPSRTKYYNIDTYNNYKNEIEKNGDKNLIVKVNFTNGSQINLFGIYSFARRYINEPYLVYRINTNDILINENEY